MPGSTGRATEFSGTTTRRIACLIGLALIAAIAGCRAPSQTEARKPYQGPTLTIDAAIQRINDNNRQVPTLWSRVYFDARIVDDKGKATTANGDGTLIYGGERRLLFTATKPGTMLFELGSNPERYWMTVPLKEVDSMWWGRYQYLNAPCAQAIPIRPDLILEVLGISQITPDLTQFPAPTMRFNPDADAYMFLWNERAPDRYIAVKEVWYDRQSLLPTLVLLFDDNGRVILRAYLSQHQVVEIPEVPREQWSMVARQFDLYFPETGSRMNLHLDRALLSYRNIPSERTFRFPTRVSVQNVVQLDEACGP